MRRPWIKLVLASLAGVSLGLFMSLPAPSDVGTFWVGNFSSPWAVLAFLAGWSQRSRFSALKAGVAAELACVAGFYGQFLVGVLVDPRRLGFVAPTDALTLVGTAVPQWLWFIAPWLVVAIGAGVVYGLLGRWWAESRSIVAGIAIALPFMLEPAAWRIYDGFGKGPLAPGSPRRQSASQSSVGSSLQEIVGEALDRIRLSAREPATVGMTVGPHSWTE